MTGSFRVDMHHAGRRLDRILRLYWPQVPLSALARALRIGEVRVDGKRGTGSDRVEEDQVITVPWDTPEQQHSFSHVGTLEILMDTPDLWAINKPAGLLSHPDRCHGDSVATRAWSLQHPSATFRPTPVHRLDRNTSGLLLVARTGSALRSLQDAWRLGGVQKIYWAVVRGDVCSLAKSGVVDAPLRKDPITNTVAISPDGMPARTLFRVLCQRPPLALIELVLETGRPHQARVHSAALGYPIFGDRKYGSSSPLSSRLSIPPRPLLHARRLVLPTLPAPLDYLSGRHITAPAPEDFSAFFGPLPDDTTP